MKVTTKGQVTIPKGVRDRLGLCPGDEVEFVVEPDGVRLRKRLSGRPLDRYRGHLKHLAERDSDELIEEMRGR
jgi:AbrB family looped-hinge helix DNA binding protein